jgi:hypothetical protein
LTDWLRQNTSQLRPNKKKLEVIHFRKENQGLGPWAMAMVDKACFLLYNANLKQKQKRRKHAIMHLTTILNRTLKFKSFVFKSSKFGKMRKGQPTIEVEIVPRKGSKAICSGCGKPRPGYDRLPVRYFEHIPLWGFLIFFVYGRRRVDCPKCGILVEKIPWVNGKEQMTESYQWFLAYWAKLLSWQEVASGTLFQNLLAPGLYRRKNGCSLGTGTDEFRQHLFHRYR